MLAPGRALAVAALTALAACAHNDKEMQPPAALTPPGAQLPSAPAPAPSAWQDEILYFVVLDRFANGDPANDRNVDLGHKGSFHGGDLRGLTAQLDEIASLGATAIWLTPVVKNIDGFVTGAGFPDWAYHGYWADDFHSLDPRFGTETELKALVDAAHARGLKVLLDVVYNHAGYGSRYLTDPKTKDWLRSPDRGDCGDPQDALTSCLAGLPDFKTERPEVADYLLDAQLGWAKRAGVDGFRLDTLKHIDHPFWQEHRRRVRAQLSPDFFLLGEVWGGDAKVLDPWFSADEIDAGIDFGFQGSTLGFISGRGRAVAYDRYLVSRHQVRPGYLLAHYLSSHDVKGALAQLEGDVEAFKLAAVLQFTVAGMPVIYYGEEVARPGGGWPENRSDMPWGARDVLPGKGKARDEGLRGFYQRLLSIRRQHPALSRGSHAAVHTGGDVYAFLREDAASGDTVLVVVNRAKTPSRLSLKAPAGWGDRTVYELLSGKEASRGPSLELSLEVGPRQALILTPR